MADNFYLYLEEYPLICEVPKERKPSCAKCLCIENGLKSCTVSKMESLCNQVQQRESDYSKSFSLGAAPRLYSMERSPTI